jgi:hypothetical protein
VAAGRVLQCPACFLCYRRWLAGGNYEVACLMIACTFLEGSCDGAQNVPVHHIKQRDACSNSSSSRLILQLACAHFRCLHSKLLCWHNFADFRPMMGMCATRATRSSAADPSLSCSGAPWIPQHPIIPPCSQCYCSLVVQLQCQRL